MTVTPIRPGCVVQESSEDGPAVNTELLKYMRDIVKRIEAGEIYASAMVVLRTDGHREAYYSDAQYESDILASLNYMIFDICQHNDHANRIF